MMIHFFITCHVTGDFAKKFRQGSHFIYGHVYFKLEGKTKTGANLWREETSYYRKRLE